jgi:hypothetical protein
VLSCPGVAEAATGHFRPNPPLAHRKPSRRRWISHSEMLEVRTSGTAAKCTEQIDAGRHSKLPPPYLMRSPWARFMPAVQFMPLPKPRRRLSHLGKRCSGISAVGAWRPGWRASCVQEVVVAWHPTPPPMSSRISGCSSPPTRRRAEDDGCSCCNGLKFRSAVADGIDQVRKAARKQMR